MVQIELDQTRKTILRTKGHVLIQGGPGCGKTTIALLRAKSNVAHLAPEQRILFLSFSRAAVRQVTDRMGGLLTRTERTTIEVRTFHAFFLELIRSHGRLLTASPAKFITPEREAQRRADYSGDWNQELKRLAEEESIFIFDTLAPTVASLVERSATVRDLYSARYPLIIVDEFQDTNRDQWRVIRALAVHSETLCLADPDQRIFDHLDGVDEHRLRDLEDALSPTQFDLSSDNHRSPGGGLLQYANAILRNQAATVPSGVYRWQYQYPVNEVNMAHRAVIVTRDVLKSRLGGEPTIAVLTRTNSLAGRISESLAENGTSPDGVELPAVDHVLAWDPELAAASALVIASILEWPHKKRAAAVIDTLRHVVDYYRTKLGNGTQGARAKIETLERAIIAVQESRAPAAKTAKVLLQEFDNLTDLTGHPVRDWTVARSKLVGSAELKEISRQARLIRLLKATDVLAWALLGAWNGSHSYLDAAGAVRAALADEALNVARYDPPPVSVMTMHKSKGKEFDAVVIVEGQHQGQFLSDDPKQHGADRRLLRVAITRARHIVGFIRPTGASSLIPLLK